MVASTVNLNKSSGGRVQSDKEDEPTSEAATIVQDQESAKRFNPLPCHEDSKEIFKPSWSSRLLENQIPQQVITKRISWSLLRPHKVATPASFDNL